MKHPKFRLWPLITVSLIMVYGCAVTKRITLPGNEIPPVESKFKIVAVILKNGESIDFDSNGGLYVEKTRDGKSYRVIVGTAHSKNVEIDAETVQEVKFEQKKFSGIGSFGLGFLVGLPLGPVFLLIGLDIVVH